MNQLINKFPIQVTTERILINNETELYDFINKYNQKTTLYYSLYDVEQKINGCSCSILLNNYHSCNTKNLNKICFDIDNLNALSIVKSMHLNLLKSNTKHLILFSGEKGFHVYIFTQNYSNLKTPKNTLQNAHSYLIQQFNIKNGIDVDSHIIGDINRLMRIPNTLHINSKLYCIPITTEDLILGKNHIMNKAKEQNFKFIYYGTQLLDIKQFDNGYINHIPPTYSFVDKEKVEISINKQELLNELPPCLQNILVQPYIHWSERFHVIKYLQHIGYANGEIDFFMKQFLEGKKHPQKGHDNFEHYIKERQNMYIQRNRSVFSCDKIKNQNLCPVQGLCSKIQEKQLYL